MPAPSLILALLFVVCFTLATWLQPWHQSWAGGRAQSSSLLDIVMGDSRQLFANHFFTKADVYFHSGYYPSVFDQAIGGAPHMTAAKDAATETDEEHGREHAEETGFLGRPRDWIDRFSRNLYPSRHSHLDSPGEAREILPWLKMSAELDPQRVETYTTAAYWLRKRMGKVDEAEQFLREGLRANTKSYEILFELGHLYYDDRHDAARARNIWTLGVKRWHDRNDQQGKQDDFILEQILTHLAQLEEREGYWEKAIAYLEKLKAFSPHPNVIQQHIEELKRKAVAPSVPNNSVSPQAGKR